MSLLLLCGHSAPAPHEVLIVTSIFSLPLFKPLLFPACDLYAPHAGMQEIQRQSSDLESEDMGAVHTLLVLLLCAMEQQSSHCGVLLGRFISIHQTS